MYKNIAIFGTSGSIGNAMLQTLHKNKKFSEIHAFSENIFEKKLLNVNYHKVTYNDELSIKEASQLASLKYPIDLIFIATGLLHSENIQPEKSLRDLNFDNFHSLFRSNTILPAIIAKHFMPKMNLKKRSIFAALSARVGSISDNSLGGWYSYRSSKVALNMVIKNLAIEMGRKSKECIIVGLHPGTVDSPLSAPFQKNVPDEKLFSPQFSSEKLLHVIDNLIPKDSGKVFAWDGTEVMP